MKWYALSYELCGERDVIENWHLLDAETEEDAAKEAESRGFEYPVNENEVTEENLR